MAMIRTTVLLTSAQLAGLRKLAKADATASQVDQSLTDNPKSKVTQCALIRKYITAGLIADGVKKK